MSSNGIAGLIVETHNWGKSVAFWRDLGYTLEDSLVLRHPAGGPFVYVDEQPDSQTSKSYPSLPLKTPRRSRPLPPVRSSVDSSLSTGECPKCCYLILMAELSASKAHCPLASRRLKAMASRFHADIIRTIPVESIESRAKAI